MSTTTTSSLKDAAARLAAAVDDREQYVAALEAYVTRAEREREEALQEAGRLRNQLEQRPETSASGVVYLLWSGRHFAWWAPDARGYTDSLEKAGRYSEAEAAQHVIRSAQCGVLEQVTSMVAAPENWPVSRG